jgi:hypothetical protein
MCASRRGEMSFKGTLIIIGQKCTSLGKEASLSLLIALDNERVGQKGRPHHPANIIN